LIEEGKQKQARVNLSKALIECLDALGFQWKLKTACDERMEKLTTRRNADGYGNRKAYTNVNGNGNTVPMAM
jgi:hypothetical protein